MSNKQKSDSEMIADYYESRAKDEAPKGDGAIDEHAYHAALENGHLSEIEKVLGKFYDEQTKPNIAFVGGRINAGRKNAKLGEEGFIPREPVTKLSDGMDMIKLPADQSKPFYHKDAARILQIVPELYKPVIDK